MQSSPSGKSRLRHHVHNHINGLIDPEVARLLCDKNPADFPFRPRQIS
jgi:hypothetical protein